MNLNPGQEPLTRPNNISYKPKSIRNRCRAILALFLPLTSSRLNDAIRPGIVEAIAAGIRAASMAQYKNARVVEGEFYAVTRPLATRLIAAQLPQSFD